MSWPHTELPAPGRFSLGRVVAARLGHARRRAQACTQNCNQGRDCTCCPPKPAEACTELGADQWTPLSRGESIHFWLVVDVVAFLSYALLVWALAP